MKLCHLALKWGFLQQKLFCLQIIYFFHVLFNCNLFEINISYRFGDIKAINLLCQQPSAQLIVTLNAKHYIVEVHTTAHERNILFGGKKASVVKSPTLAPNGRVS